MGIKISEMIEANDLQDECFIPIVQNNINKKIKKELLDETIVSPTEPTGVNRKKVWFKKGKNLFDKTNYIIDSAGKIGFVLDLEKGETYTVSSNLPLYVAKFANSSPAAGNDVGPQHWGEFVQWTFTAGDNIANVLNNTLFLGISVNTLTSNISDFDNYNIQIEKGSVATIYEDYAKPDIYVLNSNNIYEKMYSNSVAETGENEYFKYIKFSNGTLIQYATMIFNNLTWNSWGSLYYAECNVSQYKFPVPFIGRPVVNGSIAHGTGSGDGWISRIGSISTTDIGTLAITRPTTYADSMYVNITAVGRWK